MLADRIVQRDENNNIDWDKTCEVLKRQALFSLAYYELKDFDMPEEVRRLIEKEAVSMTLKNYRLWWETRRISNKLEEAGIRNVVIKGPATAYYYPIPESRKSGDVDLALLPSDMEKAGVILLKEGCILDKSSDAQHHDAYIHPAGFEIEVHRLFIEPRGIGMIDKRLKRDFIKGINTSKQIKLMKGFEFNSLREDYHALYLLLHMSGHYLTKGFSLRLLVDWVYFWNYGQSNEIKRSFNEMTKELYLEAFGKTISAYCIRRLGLKEECSPYENVISQVKKEVTDALEEEILSGGEFAQADKGQLITAADTSIFGMFLILHREMKRQHPKVGRIVLIYPLLWVYTGIKFMVNNKRLNRGSTLSIVKKMRDRSTLAKELKPFEG